LLCVGLVVISSVLESVVGEYCGCVCSFGEWWRGGVGVLGVY